ncbi:hypothetical protein COT98_00485 [Candidatus Falkowbacteria bacterium CG10_big_fil_rev_8_21_14_0_10_39_9]|uniref:EamA domain-containing protein n=1 Tax=Candidatus Falkowbacteria bacterium CG10_big_fil_rev_8_21_14_0_10_39_9 TaxID=1974566 RepID=A0A2M6WR38_9BACT|nr:MAG: hypothetical protein COT98_00485 [Candidatus Falkowbacteria bacterium CG10_big_fil_rev_8_21_14_0_10_39_9]
MSDFQVSLFFAFLAMFLWGIGDFFIQRTIRKVGDFQTLLWINFIASLTLFPLAWNDLPAIFSRANIFSLIFITIIDLFYGYFLFKAYDQGKLSVVEVVMIGELPFTIILGLIFFHESLSWLQVFVILMIIAGVFLMSRSRKTWRDKIKEFFRGKRVVWEKGLLLMFLAVLFSSLYNFLTAVNTRNVSAFAAVWFPWMLGSLVLLIYVGYKRGLKSFWQGGLNHKSLILFTGVIDTSAWVFYALATRTEEISIVTAIVAGYAVIAMALGIKFNHEKISVWQYLGAVLVFLGVIAMSFISGPNSL